MHTSVLKILRKCYCMHTSVLKIFRKHYCMHTSVLKILRECWRRPTSPLALRFYLIRNLTTDEETPREARTVDIFGVAVYPLVEILLILVEQILHAGVQL